MMWLLETDLLTGRSGPPQTGYSDFELDRSGNSGYFFESQRKRIHPFDCIKDRTPLASTLGTRRNNCIVCCK